MNGFQVFGRLFGGLGFQRFLVLFPAGVGMHGNELGFSGFDIFGKVFRLSAFIFFVLFYMFFCVHFFFDRWMRCNWGLGG